MQPLGPILVHIFMGKLEHNIVQTFQNYLATTHIVTIFYHISPNHESFSGHIPTNESHSSFQFQPEIEIDE